jgi:prepilin-type N-terminal cleavage/methylation domain-containing protein
MINRGDNLRFMQRRRGFTLIEVLVAGVIISLLAALVFFAAGLAVRSSRLAAEQQLLRSMMLSIQQYESVVGSVPPLVADGPTVDTGPVINVGPRADWRVRIQGESTVAVSAFDPLRVNRFLRFERLGDNNDALRRFSTYTPALYLVGSLGAEFDGVDGPGFSKPDRDGAFVRGSGTVKPYLDVSGAFAQRLRIDPTVVNATAERTQVVDRWGNPVRYYRWTPLNHVVVRQGVPAPVSVYRGPFPVAGNPEQFAIQTAPGNNAAREGEVRSFNVPPAVGNAFIDVRLRSAKCAVVSAGPDGRINDDDPAHPDNADNLVEVGP